MRFIWQEIVVLLFRNIVSPAHGYICDERDGEGERASKSERQSIRPSGNHHRLSKQKGSLLVGHSIVSLAVSPYARNGKSLCNAHSK